MHFRPQRFIAALVLLAVAIALPVVDAAPSQAATRLKVSPTNPVPREYINISGRFETSVRRPVYLQYWTGSRWASMAKKSTTSTGRFGFSTRAQAPARKFRAMAPRYGRYGATTTAARTVKTVRPTAQMSFIPVPIAQAKSDTSRTNLTPFSTRFTPARQGRKVVLQHYSAGSWRTVASSVQARNGTSSFKISPRLGGNHRALTVAAKGAAAVKSSARTVRHLPLDFNDNFGSWDTTKWDIRMEGSREGGGRECSISSAKSVSVADGTLRLQTKRMSPSSGKEDDPLTLVDESDNPDWESGIDCPYGQFYNGHIGARGQHKDIKYGFMAARIKLQPQRGHHGGFWSQPTNGSVSGAEIDTLEYYGDSYPGAPIQHSIYQANAVKAKVLKDRRYLLGSGQTWSNSYHVFSVEWTPTRYIFRIDGVETFRTTRGVSSTDQYPILSLLTSGWELPNLPRSGTLHPMYVDWVRTWQR